jgi:putative chitinase
MAGINIEGAIIAAAGRGDFDLKVLAAVKGMLSVKEQLDEMGTFDTMERLGSTIGQCAHESMGFQRTTESLWYSAKRLTQVWHSRYPTLERAAPYAKNPEKLANHTYANRNGNGNEASGDGWRFRGRGWQQLTGRANYRSRGLALGIDLEGNPDLALQPGIRWLIAASFNGSQRRGGKTVWEWADLGNLRMVTRTINGGTHGLEDRGIRTDRALNALT